MTREPHWCAWAREVCGNCKVCSAITATVVVATIHPSSAPSPLCEAGWRKLSAVSLNASPRSMLGDRHDFNGGERDGIGLSLSVSYFQTLHCTLWVDPARWLPLHDYEVWQFKNETGILMQRVNGGEWNAGKICWPIRFWKAVGEGLSRYSI